MDEIAFGKGTLPEIKKRQDSRHMTRDNLEQKRFLTSTLESLSVAGLGKKSGLSHLILGLESSIQRTVAVSPSLGTKVHWYWMWMPVDGLAYCDVLSRIVQ